MTPSNRADTDEDLTLGGGPRRGPSPRLRDHAARAGSMTAVLGVTILLLVVIALFLFGPLL